MVRTIRNAGVIVLLMYGAALGVQSAQELFLHGNKAYHQTAFAQALEWYSRIPTKGPGVWYNMGNCYYQIGDLSRAIVCWHRACAGASIVLYRRAQNNIARAYTQLGQSYVRSWGARCNDWVYTFPLGVLQLLWAILWICIWWLIGRRKYTWPTMMRVSLLILGLVYGAIVLAYRYYEQQPYGIVVVSAAPLAVGPHEQYHAVGQVTIADQVQLIEKRDKWYRVARGNTQGWIIADAIEVIIPVSGAQESYH
jgi:tetratricopeptide (TPR) repeat protein